MPTCPQCGSNNSDTSTSCWKCYAPLTAGASAGAAAPSAPTATAAPRAAAAPRPVAAPRSRSKGSPLPIIIVIVLLLAVGGGGGYYWFVLKPVQDAKTTATEFMKAQLDLDANKMKQFSTSASGQILDQLGQLFTALSQFKSMIKVEKVEAGSPTITGSEAQVPVNVSVSGQSNTINVVMVKENGAWKVDVLKSNQANAALGAQAMQQLLKQGGGMQLPGMPGIGGR